MPRPLTAMQERFCLEYVKAGCKDAGSVTLTGHLKELAALRDDAKNKEQYSAAIQAEISRGKCAGLYLERKVVKLDATVLAAMSPEELEALADQLDSITESVH